MLGLKCGAAFARIGSRVTNRSRGLRSDAGFTLIEVLMAALILAIIAAPLAAVLLAGSALAGDARERTAADELAQTAIETMRTLSYTQVGINGGNPDGDLTASTSAKILSGEAVTLATKVSWVSDPIPGAYVTNADYKKVVITVTRNSDGRQLAQKTTLVASASAPPLNGTSWVQIKRTVVDAVTQAPIVGATVHLTGGPNAEDRTDTSDAAGVVDFPALGSSAQIPPPNYLLATTMPTYLVFPDDISPGVSGLVPATPGLSSTDTIQMYQPVSLTVNVRNSSGVAYTSGATISLDSSRCGKQTISIPSGSSSATITTCDYANGKTVSLVPNVTGQVPLFDKYFVTAWSGNFWGATPSTGVLVPSAYPTTLTQTVNVNFVTQNFPNTKTVTVTVNKSGSPDGNARVEVTGGPVGISSVYLFGVTNASGQVTLTIPVTSTATTYTVNANDMGTAKATWTFSASTLSTSPIPTSGTIS